MRTTKVLVIAAAMSLAMTGASWAQVDNADLSSLVPSAGALTPAFDSATITYSAIVPGATTSITVTPTTVEPLATVTVNGNPVTSGNPSSSIALSLGPNVITTEVTAEDTVTTKTYTLTVHRVSDSALIYEPFHDPDSPLASNTASIGLSGTWQTPTGAWAVASPSISFGTLATSDNKVNAPASTNAQAYAAIDASTLNGLLDDGRYLWFSTVVNTPASGGTNPDTGFAIGTKEIPSNVMQSSIGAGNAAIGWTIKSDKVQASIWNQTSSLRPTATTSNGVATNTIVLVVGKIAWGVNASTPDTVQLYLPNSGTLLPGGAISSQSAVIDQSALDTISTALKSNTAYAIDEIRFGASYADVVPNTADVTAPTLASTSPVHSTTDTAYVLQATFDEPVKVGTGQIRIYSGAAPGSLVHTITLPDASQALMTDHSTLSIKPSVSLVPGTTYYVEMDLGSLEDSNGNDFAGFTGDATWSFTQETTAPTLAAVDIVDQIYGGGSIAIAPATFDYVVTFSEPMDPATVNVADFINADAAAITVNSVTPGAPIFVMGTATNTFTVSVSCNVAGGTVTLQVPNAATLTDCVGNAIAGLPVTDVETINIIAPPATATITGSTANTWAHDTWNLASNWDIGVVPSGTIDVIVNGSLAAECTNPSTPAYTGNLTLSADSSLQLGWSGTGAQPTANNAADVNAMGTGTITMNGNTQLRFRLSYTANLPAGGLVMSGAGKIFLSPSTSAHSTTRNVTGPISGAGLLTVEGNNNNTITLNAASPSWSGGLDTSTEGGQSWRVIAKANGCLGTGDVVINGSSNADRGTALVIDTGVTDAISDSAALKLNGGRDHLFGATSERVKLVLRGSETVGEFWVDGVQQAAGDYTSASGLVTPDGDPLIGGAGTLTVINGPGGGTAFDTWAATGTLGPVTFDGDTNGDGVKDGMAFLLGVTNPDDDANGNLPTVSEDGSGNLVLTFNCLPIADRGTSTLKVEHSNDLAIWTSTVDVVPDADDAVPDNDVTYVVDSVIAAPLNKVTATIGVAGSGGTGKLFGHLKAENP